MFSVVDKAKWEAWMACGSMPPAQAKRMYVGKLAALSLPGTPEVRAFEAAWCAWQRAHPHEWRPLVRSSASHAHTHRRSASLDTSLRAAAAARPLPRAPLLRSPPPAEEEPPPAPPPDASAMRRATSFPLQLEDAAARPAAGTAAGRARPTPGPSPAGAGTAAAAAHSRGVRRALHLASPAPPAAGGGAAAAQRQSTDGEGGG